MEDRQVNRRRITVRSVEKAGYIFAHEYLADGSASSSQKNQLHRMENEMRKRFGNDSTRTKNSEDIDFLTENLVAVAFTSKQSWVRGFVLDKRRSKSDLRLRIQLIDYCSQDLFPLDDVRPLPSDFNTSALECQSMKIVLYGVEAAYFKIDLVNGNKLMGNMHFYDKDVKFINEQLEEAESIYFEEICRVEEFYFGNIILKQSDGSLLNLKDLLLQNAGAVEIADFEQNIPEYIKGFRRNSIAFDHELAVRKLLFPAISFSDVERSTDTDNTEYYRHSPVDEVPNHESKILRKIKPANNSNDVHKSTNSSTSEEKSPAPRFFTEQSSDEFSILIDKIVVVTGGPNNQVQPVNSFSESPLDSETFHMLKRLHVRDMTRCQKYLVPAVLSGQNVTLIEAPGAGKTSGVLISLVSLMRKTAKSKEKGLGARAIVVCPYAAKCEQVHRNCLQIIRGRLRVTDESDDPVTVNVAYGLGTELEENNLIDLLKGYDILACTPRRLLRLLVNEKAFNFDRLSHIIFDDMNTLLNSYGDEVRQILEHVRRKPMKAPQRIIISDHWVPELKPFIKEDIELKRGSLLISSYKDAALFVRLRSTWTCMDDPDKKLKNIIEMLNNVLGFRNVVVVFSDESDDIDSVHQEVRNECPKPTYKIRNFELLHASDTVKDWKNDVMRGRFPVLFCTDYALRNVQIYEADYLIHYSLPKSKTDYLFRFSVLLHRLQCVSNEILKATNHVTHPFRRPEMYIYSNFKENDEQFPEIVKIMQQLNAVIPDTDRMRKIMRQKEMIKKELGLCPNIKEYGRCHRESRCKFRHIVLPDDTPDKALPSNGYIKPLIVYIYSATHYGVRILEHAPESTGPWTPVRGLPNPDMISLKLKRHFCEVQNRKICAHNEVGDIVAFRKNDEFYRVQIIKLLQVDSSEENEEEKTPKRVLVKFIDKGEEEEISAACLMALPESLAAIPPGIVDVFVCNLLPIDGDIAWGSQITRIVRDQLMNAQKGEKCYFVGKIELVLGRSLWLDSLKCEEVKAVFSEPLPLFSVPKLLKKQQLAISHEEHLPLLLRLRQDAGVKEVDSPISNGHSDENVLNGNADINVVPKNEDKDSAFEKIHPRSTGRRDERDLSAVLAVVEDTPSRKELLSKKEKDACFEIIHSPKSIDHSEKSQSDKTNNDHEFKKPHSVELKTTINDMSSVLKKPLKPQVEWRQDSTYVILTVAVNSDPHNFKVHITKKADDPRKDVLNFSASMDDKFYEFSEALYGRIRIPTVESYKSGVFICIKMAKLIKGCKWEQLFRMKIPYRWVRMDQNIDDSSEDESRKAVSLFPRHPRGNICRDANRYDANSDSTDDSDAPGFCPED